MYKGFRGLSWLFGGLNVVSEPLRYQGVEDFEGHSFMGNPPLTPKLINLLSWGAPNKWRGTTPCNNTASF